MGSMLQQVQSELIQQLRNDLLQMEGLKVSGYATIDAVLGPLKDSFPNRTFPIGAVHEFLIDGAESSAATTGFLSGLLQAFMQESGVTFWISGKRTIFPPSLKRSGIKPEHLVFVDLNSEKDVVWAIDEALKCGALTTVIGEVSEFDFTASRRMQLAAEHSGVTCFVFRRYKQQNKLTPTASVSRWKITHLPSIPMDGLPGIGHPQWKVELVRIRNGKTGAWNLKWGDGRYEVINQPSVIVEVQKKTG